MIEKCISDMTEDDIRLRLEELDAMKEARLEVPTDQVERTQLLRRRLELEMRRKRVES